MKLKELFNLTGIPIFIASLCCLAPIVLVLLGLSTVSVAAALTEVLDGKYQWAFILLGLILFGISLIFYFRDRGVCTLDQVKKHQNEIINKVLLTLVFSVVGYLIFFDLILGLVGRILGIWK